MLAAPGDSDEAPQLHTPFVVLYDQPSASVNNSTSQNFEAAYDDYDNQGADDFVVTAGSGWNVTTVFAPGAYSVTHGTPASLRVTFFQNAAGIPGASICDFPALTFVEAPVGSFTINIPGGCVLSAGTKWVSVVANLNFAGGGGQWFWTTRTVLTGNPAKWQNPGGGFATPCTTWGTRTTCLNQTEPDQGFRLEGNLASCSIDADCADGNLCNGVETCTAGTCNPGTAVVCNDGLFCTIDSCVPATGACATVPNPCSDGNSCTTDICDEANDTCASAGSPPVHICNTTPILIPATGTAAGVAAPYPSPIVIAGLPTQASVCSVELLNGTHSWRGDIDVMLSSPLGGTSNRTIMSDVGGSGDLANTNITLQDGAPAMPATGNLVSGTYSPINTGAVDAFDAPAPAPTGLAPLSGFDGINPNGTWNLWIRDDAGGDVGNFSGGWCLNLITGSCSNDGECNDGNACNGLETCNAGTCVPGTAVNCNDNLFCTIDSCTPATGACVNAPNPCADTDGCTNDTCNEATDTCDHISGCVSFCSTAPILLNDSAGGTPPTAATPYPSTVAVAGVNNGTLAQVRLLGYSHTFPDDTDVMLVSNNGVTNATVMSDVGLGTDVTNLNLTLSDAAAASLPDGGPLVSGTFKPTNIDTTTDAYLAPAPPASNLAPLSTFPAGNQNGNWSLFVIDDANIDSGTLTQWCLDFVTAGGGCTQNSECDDSDACTNDVCNAGTCENTAIVCDDGLYCNGTETCNSASGCVAGVPVVCNDGVACTVDSCNEATDSCDATPNNAACDDGLYCNGAETCTAAGCQAGVPVVCNDGVACTADSCNEATNSCDYTPNNALCDDGLYCNGAETCTATGCAAGAPVVCDDGVACTVDSCNEATNSCDATPNNAACDDGLYCNGAETCTAAGCQAGAPVVCDDGVACTADSCDEASDSCAYAPNNALCDDGLYCNGAETCTATGCAAGAPVVCDDGVACTVDSCVEATDSCEFAPNNAACDDGNVCTDDVCTATGCAYSNNTAPCDDGAICTTGDTCQSGVCVGNTTQPDPKTKGHYKKMCRRNELTAAEAACVAQTAPLTFGDVDTVAEVCDEIDGHDSDLPSHDSDEKHCTKDETELLVLALNLCTGRVCPSQPIDSHYGDNTTVQESLDEADQIFGDPARDKDTCHAGKDLAKEINNGKALRMDTLTLSKVGNADILLQWTPPFMGEDQSVVKYEVWRSVRGADTFVRIHNGSSTNYIDRTDGEFDYEVLAEIQD